jgi:negative regulator of flagellin synthesis FlgM
MATTPINNSNKMTNPLLAPKQDGAKANRIDPASLVKPDGVVGAAAKGNGAGSAALDVNISPSAKRKADERTKALTIAKNTPEVREDRVADLKARIASGKYEVDSGKIADGMMREAVIEHLAETTERGER